ncbi:MAG TPA: ribbon-helix-helix domain-containing protein [Candidatus Competibacteraceae bacterium]|nr:ribbon-helix-helix domain-containing protein [Candidatus Competibacteraceae bacterium]HRZ04642.1 ribbon-helix-helix domain-containing protein [Candidatus Competibacteraceae bacterium]HSA44936.1 ribbon-helix-helix domain-containing protein [Candidatus Competibacteraceae bacterium]
MTSVRLPNDIKEKLQMLSISRHKSKSDIIKEALELFLKTENEEKDSYEIGKELFGRFGSGGNDVDYKTRVKDKIRAKHHSH